VTKALFGLAVVRETMYSTEASEDKRGKLHAGNGLSVAWATPENNMAAINVGEKMARKRFTRAS
jgi:hypothetical protein